MYAELCYKLCIHKLGFVHICRCMHKVTCINITCSYMYTLIFYPHTHTLTHTHTHTHTYIHTHIHTYTHTYIHTHTHTHTHTHIHIHIHTHTHTHTHTYTHTRNSTLTFSTEMMYSVSGSPFVFPACHQCWIMGSSLGWGLNFQALVCFIFLG